MFYYANNDYPKERLTSTFLSCNSFLSAWTWVEDKEAQCLGVDLSCQRNGTGYYIDLKLKNSGFTDKPSDTSNRWSVEMYRLKRGRLVQGWFAADNSMTNIIGFEEAFGQTFSNLDCIDLYMFAKKKLKNTIEESTQMDIIDIREKARYMLEYDVKYIKLNDTFCLSRTGRDIDNYTINLCFSREVIENISKRFKIVKR